MNMLQRLLSILLTEMIDDEKQKTRESLTKCLLIHSLRDVKEEEIDMTKTQISSMDENRAYVDITMKNGTKLIVPLNKEHLKSKRYSFIKKLG